MLDIESVSKKYRGGNFGVRDLTLHATSGVLGLVGPNGAGKTTLMQMIATITRPTTGRILFKGEDVVRKPNALRARLGYLPQDFGVYENLTAREFLRYFASLKGVRSPQRVDEMLEMVNLHGVATRAVGGFSGGMRQRLGIAQALINDPEMVIVDEPTAGLDPEERVRFRNILSDLGSGRLVILSTHIVSDVESIATSIAVMREGHLVALDAPESLMQQASGTVWEIVVSSAEFERLRGNLRVSSVMRRPDGVHARVVAASRPIAEAVAAEPTLEDAFLAIMSGTTATPHDAGAVA
jgi:ABC-type multidrug transport system ATPase subunit